ncbi:uncharacterized protein A4U43_C06F17520 [Asparagus officinalis]|uniref:POT1A/B-like OB fold domain-containing protein n=1 Tax=Asparagus officinalis TaxID=4686 RepID=A0A5P1EMH4_ASPOF|nr:protection of telomeres protein 1a-like [Asparagus officinalis]ONK67205.1 uncharacterized protein A4U43_C06F17520 [Asparagus officinalis]
MDSITNTQVPHWLKCVVRVVAACPWRGEDLRSPLDGCYCVRLTLEDPTARIHAYILGEEGVKFFGYNPTVDQLTRQMSRLLGIKDSDGEEKSCASRDPPWIWCFLMCYYLDKKDPWGSRRYRIIDTRLVD